MTSDPKNLVEKDPVAPIIPLIPWYKNPAYWALIISGCAMLGTVGNVCNTRYQFAKTTRPFLQPYDFVQTFSSDLRWTVRYKIANLTNAPVKVTHVWIDENSVTDAEYKDFHDDLHKYIRAAHLETVNYYVVAGSPQQFGQTLSDVLSPHEKSLLDSGWKNILFYGQIEYTSQIDDKEYFCTFAVRDVIYIVPHMQVILLENSRTKEDYPEALADSLGL